MTRRQRILRSLSPAVANPPVTEVLRAAFGTGLALILCFWLVDMVMPGGAQASVFLISPLAATAFLAFAVPSSPLAQPWPAVVGNTVSGLIGVAVVLSGVPHLLGLGLAVALSMAAMMRLRALHPPAAGVALGAVLTADLVREVGLSYAFLPVFVDTVLLLAMAAAYNRLTGRRYPFRQVEPAAPAVTAEVTLRPALAEPALNAILQRLRLDANIGAGDLSRLIDSAHAEAARHLFDGVTAAAIMARDPVSVPADLPQPQILAVLRARSLRSIPVVDAAGAYVGLILEGDLAARGDVAPPAEPGLLARLRGTPPLAQPVPIAADLARQGLGTASPETALGVLIDLLASGGQQVVPVLDGGRLVGIVSRGDLIATLARAHHPAMTVAD